MRRVGKHLVTSVTTLVPIWPPTRYDPNGYYAALGLETNRVVMTWEIRRAYLRKMKELHPDMGNQDLEAYHRARLAYTVLSNPTLRLKYDNLGPDERFNDGLTSKTGDGFVVVERISVVSDGRDGSVISDWDPVVYLDDDVEVDEDDIRAWVYEFVRAWSAWMPGEIVRVGFGREVRVEWRPWGVVAFVPAGFPPSSGLANYLVAQIVRQIRPRVLA